jgi:predicted phage terminase large subunit-like protein
VTTDTPEEYTFNELRMLKTGCVDSLLFTARTFFKERDRTRFIVSQHHRVMCEALDKVFTGEITRLIINIPPGYTKTELAVIFFVVKGLLVNPASKFMHTSYSADLALLNSGIIKDIIQSELFQAICPTILKYDTKAKARWYTHHGGGMMAAAAGGQITGFRAGRMDKTQFTGALIVDDPIKPADAISRPMREAVNRNFNLTVKSRLATENTPIVVIMQRVHEDDLTGYLLNGGSHESWHHVNIPADIPEHLPKYPPAWKCGIPIPHNLPPGPCWEYKHNTTELATLKRANSFVWASQYQQNPTSIDATVFSREWFGRFIDFDPVENCVVLASGRRVQIRFKKVFADTAMKTGQHNDFSVFQHWGRGEDGKIYLLEQVRGKWDAVDLESKFKKFLSRLVYVPGVNNMSPRAICVEDKASGTGLIQSLNRKVGFDDDLKGLPKITGIQRNKDKVSRALSAAPEIEKGLVVLPETAYWLEEFLAEVASFSVAMTHSHDDQIDPMLDAVHEMLIGEGFMDYDLIVGM